MSNNTDHVVWDTLTNSMVCKRCGQTYMPNLPAPMQLVSAMLKAFVNIHKNCVKRPE